MSDGHDPLTHTTQGWRMQPPAHGPLEGHHGPHAHRFSRLSETIDGLALAVGLAIALVYLGLKQLPEGGAPISLQAMLLAGAAFLAAVALVGWTIYKAHSNRGAIVIDPVERYVDLPARLMTAAHRAAPTLLWPAPGRARIAFADITAVERRQHGRGKHRIVYLYLADRYGEVHLDINDAEISTAVELVTGWRAR